MRDRVSGRGNRRRSDAVLTGVATTTAGVLAVFFARRLLFLSASLRTRPASDPSSGEPPTLLVVLSARNESGYLGRTLAAFDRIDYPLDRLRIALADDNSSDGTGDLMTAFAATRDHACVFALRASSGKAAALNTAIAASPGTELVAICDADQAPRPDCFRKLAAAFVDPRVGAVTGYLFPANADATVISRYAAVETWVHQLVTSAGKDRLDLNPPMLGGGSVYRRKALDEIGGFSERAFAEDLHSTFALTSAGWRTRFVQEAVVENLVPARPTEYWHQHVRWARGVLDSTDRPRRGSRSPIARRVEAVLQGAGYLDRVAVLAAAVLARARALPGWLPAGYLGLAGVEAAAGVVKAGVGRRLPRYLLATAVCFPVDLAGAVAAAAAQLARRPLVWQSPRTEARKREPNSRR